MRRPPRRVRDCVRAESATITSARVLLAALGGDRDRVRRAGLHGNGARSNFRTSPGARACSTNFTPFTTSRSFIPGSPFVIVTLLGLAETRERLDSLRTPPGSRHHGGQDRVAVRHVARDVSDAEGDLRRERLVDLGAAGDHRRRRSDGNAGTTVVALFDVVTTIVFLRRLLATSRVGWVQLGECPLHLWPVACATRLG